MTRHNVYKKDDHYVIISSTWAAMVATGKTPDELGANYVKSVEKNHSLGMLDFSKFHKNPIPNTDPYRFPASSDDQEKKEIEESIRRAGTKTLAEVILGE